MAENGLLPEDHEEMTEEESSSEDATGRYLTFITQLSCNMVLKI
jgi:hypothetical protein